MSLRLHGNAVRRSPAAPFPARCIRPPGAPGERDEPIGRLPCPRTSAIPSYRPQSGHRVSDATATAVRTPLMHLRTSPPGRPPILRQGARLALESLEDRTVLSTAAPAPLIDLSGLALNTSSYDPGHILVRYREGATPQAVLAGTSLGKTID